MKIKEKQKPRFKTGFFAVKTKICGITSVQDAKMVSFFPVDFIGLNFVKRSKRKINVKTAKEIIKSIRKSITPVLIFENENIKNVLEICKKTKVKIVQLHGNESKDYCKKLRREKIKIIKALSSRMKTYENVCDYLLIDSQNKKNQMGGTGKKANWTIARKIISKSKLPVFLAGGINPNNVKAAIKEVKPYGIDVNSGIERSIGKKDCDLLKKLFI